MDLMTMLRYYYQSFPTIFMQFNHLLKYLMRLQHILTEEADADAGKPHTCDVSSATPSGCVKRLMWWKDALLDSV